MADLKSIGNSATNVLFAASLAMWALVLARKSLGKSPLSPQPQEQVVWPALPVCATFLVAFFLPVFIVSLAAPGEKLSLAAVQWRCVGLAAQGLVVVGLLAFAGPLRKQDFGWDLSRWRRDMLVGLAGFLASLAPVFLVTKVLADLGWRGPDDKHLFFKILDGDSGHEILGWIALSVVVVAPLAEELLYRVLLQGWSQAHIAPWKAIVFSATIFSLAHQEHDWLPLFPLALILGYVYHRTRSYLATVVLHSLFNATNLTLAVLTHS
jgi:uncharacterized protein